MGWWLRWRRWNIGSVDDDERARRTREANAALQPVFERTVTPQPWRTRRDTARLIAAQHEAEQQVATALGVIALPEAGARALRAVIAAAEQRCEQRHGDRIAQLETREAELVAEVEAQRRSLAQAHFDWNLQVQDFEAKIASLQRRLERQRR